MAARLAFERLGSGPPVVLLHGIGHDRHAWDPIIGLLAPRRELVLVDLPGHGGSPLPGSNVPDVSELTVEVDRLLSELGLDRPVVVGNSLGGAIALELARRGCARAVVALSPIGFWSWWDVPSWSSAVDAKGAVKLLVVAGTAELTVGALSG